MRWTEIQIEFLISVYPDQKAEDIAKVLGVSIRSVYNKAADLKLKKSEAFMKSSQSGRLKNPAKEFWFEKGHTPDNKGKDWSQWMSPEGRKNSLRTTFKNGHLPHNTKSDGAISIRPEDGKPYQFIRVAKGKWKPLQIHLWEQNNGPVPKGLLVVFKDRNPSNCTLDNLELITRAENARRNSIHRYPRELKFAMRILKKLKRKIDGKEQNSRPEKFAV